MNDLIQPEHAAKVRGIIRELREHLEQLSSDDRMRVFDEVQAGYCTSCGDKQPPKPHRPCQCWNDE
jgi:hypothetical protein